VNLQKLQAGLLPLAVIFAAYGVADLTSALIEKNFTPPLAKSKSSANVSLTNTVNATAANGVAPGSALSLPSELQYVLNNTATRNPLAIANSTNLAIATASLNVTPAAVASGPLPKLTGTLAGGGHSLAVLQSGDETKVCGIGEIFNGYEVQEVSPFAVILKDSQGGLQRVSLDLAQTQSGPIGPPPVANVTANITTAPNVTNNINPGGEVPLSRRQMQDMMDHTGWLSQMQMKPIRRNDEIIGMQINYSNPDNPFSKLGVVTGDILSSLNGHPLKGPEDFQWAYQELRNATQLNLNLERNGQMTPLNVRLTE
jgi:type II secretion system protein C